MLKFREITSDEELRELQKLRYEVYCLEKRFLLASHYPDCIETDEFDPHSVHFAAIYMNDEPLKITGALRLILDSKHRFPLENHFQLLQPIIERDRTVELSRLIIAPEARKDQTIAILMGLSREAYRYCRVNNIEHCYAALESPFLRVLRRLGLLFVPTGPTQWYFNSENQPYYLSVSECDEVLRQKNAPFYAYLHGSGHDP